MVKLWSALIVLVWDGENCQKHGKAPVHVQQAKDEEHPPEDDHPVGVEHHSDKGEHNGDNNDDLRDLEAPLVVGGVVQNNVRQGVIMRHPVMGESQAEGGHKEPKYKEKETQDSLNWLIREYMLLLLGERNVYLDIRGGRRSL